MPSITVPLNRFDAKYACDLIHGYSSEPGIKAQLTSFMEAVLVLWPELLTVKETPAIEARDIQVSPKQQKALAEMLLALAQNKEKDVSLFGIIKSLAKALRLWGWVSSHIKDVEDFEGPLDGEPMLLDAE